MKPKTFGLTGQAHEDKKVVGIVGFVSSHACGAEHTGVGLRGPIRNPLKARPSG